MKWGIVRDFLCAGVLILCAVLPLTSCVTTVDMPTYFRLSAAATEGPAPVKLWGYLWLKIGALHVDFDRSPEDPLDVESLKRARDEMSAYMNGVIAGAEGAEAGAEIPRDPVALAQWRGLREGANLLQAEKKRTRWIISID